MKEFTYTKIKFENHKLFHSIKFTGSDITFTENNQHVILGLKRNKIDIKYIEIKIIIAATHNFLCPISALYKLFIFGPQLNNIILLSLNSKITFPYNPIIEILYQKL